MMLRLGHFSKKIRNTRKVLKCGVGEGWRRSVGSSMWKMKYYIQPRREISCKN